MDAQTDSKRVITVEYTLLKGVNDSVEQARELAALLRGYPCKINLIPFNPFPQSSYERPSRNAVSRFWNVLTEAGHRVTVRTTRGDDIDAACGQLVGQVQDARGAARAIVRLTRPLPLSARTGRAHEAAWRRSVDPPAGAARAGAARPGLRDHDQFLVQGRQAGRGRQSRQGRDGLPQPGKHGKGDRAPQAGARARSELRAGARHAGAGVLEDRRVRAGQEHFRKAIASDPQFSRARNNYAASSTSVAIRAARSASSSTCGGHVVRIARRGVRQPRRAYQKVARPRRPRKRSRARSRWIGASGRRCSSSPRSTTTAATTKRRPATTSSSGACAAADARSLLLGIRLARLASDRDAKPVIPAAEKHVPGFRGIREFSSNSSER